MIYTIFLKLIMLPSISVPTVLTSPGISVSLHINGNKFKKDL